ncbi:hypothetical protein D9Q98_004494 [Chlorella vulgaris]|uniref:Uncharacterized protein n=1 Tax=Chlorella vulgaris TaxID=3077 RepID=A0A9D4TPR2_CHLVU|nr:hypothetical protein D9Q98_004494 [Chlorella vulgaris]
MSEPADAAGGMAMPSRSCRGKRPPPQFSESRKRAKATLQPQEQPSASLLPPVTAAQPSKPPPPTGDAAAATAAAALLDAHQLEQQQRLKAETAALKAQLAEAYSVFQEQGSKHQLFLEVDVAAKVAARELIGRTLRVYWEDDDAWYAGKVAGYNHATKKHTIHYFDGEEEEVILALERVRLMMHPGERLQQPKAGPLCSLAAGLQEQAQKPANHQQVDVMRRRAGELLALSKRLEAEEHAAVVSSPLSALGAWAPVSVMHACAMAAMLPKDAVPEGMQGIQQPADPSIVTGPYSFLICFDDKAEGGCKVTHKRRSNAVVAKDLATIAQALITGKPRQQLLLEAAGYEQDAELMSQLRKLQTEQEVAAYLEGLLCSQQRIRQQQQPQAAVGLDAAQGSLASGWFSGSGLTTVQLSVAATPAGTEHTAVNVSHDAGPASGAAAAAAAAAHQHDGLQPPANSTLQRGPSGASVSTSLHGAAGASGTAGAGGTSDGGAADAVSLLPGEVAWFKASGYNHWPCMCITQEEGIHRGLSAVHFKNPAHIAVQYFGSGEVQAINPAAVEKYGSKKNRRRLFASFLEGLELGYHAPSIGRKMNELRRAFFEVIAYLKEGDLPPCMVPRHNDGSGVEEEEDGEGGQAGAGALAAKPAKRPKAKGKAQGPVDITPGALPVQINSQLTLLELGEVEWLHPGFHNAKFIFPPGFKAQRYAKTPASGREMVPHLLEVLRAPDHSGPLFRVTPQGCQPVEAPTATKAWQALYACDEAGQARSLGISGEAMFGLALESVQRAIQHLPGAHRCDCYCGWPEGLQPEAPPLSAEEQRERLACEARMQRLPEGVSAIPVSPGAPGVCHVCNEEEEDDEDLIVQCDKCRVFVHMACYGVKQAPHGALWLCDVCSLGLQRPPPCALCPVVGGALKRTTCGRWAHPTCALWLPETSLDVSASHLRLQGLVQGVQQVHRTRFQLTCKLCGQQHGACTQCCEPRCYVGFHPLCARHAGYGMEIAMVSEGESEDECDEAEQVPVAQQQQQGEGPRAGSCDENDAAAPNGTTKGDSQQGASGMVAAAAAAKPKHRTKRQEGVLVGNARLLAYCPKHIRATSKPAQRPPPARHSAAAAVTAAVAAAAAADALVSARPGSGMAVSQGVACSRTAQQDSLWQQQQQQLSSRQHSWMGGAAPLPPGALSAAVSASSDRLQQAAAFVAAPAAAPICGGARAMPFCHAARRGQRAPEAVAAAEAKRTFMRSLPYLVGGPLQQELAELPPSRRREGWQAEGGLVCRCVDEQSEEEERIKEGKEQEGDQQHQHQQDGVEEIRPDGSEPLAASEAAAAEPERQTNEQPHTQQQQQQQQRQVAAPPLGGLQGQAGAAVPAPPVPVSGGAQPTVPNQQQQQQEQQPDGSSPAAGQARLLVSPGSTVMSDAGRYAEAVATLGYRVTIGKSAIHGWGAFAKRRHAAHDMVIEYVGELVRPSVSDLRQAAPPRESRVYDGLVGAGTYVFRLNKALCVDATRAGNLAHMLNHSCDPNCYSRTISITEGGTGGTGTAGSEVVDHVVIFAKRDIQIGEELTYDYRFCGKEQLPCNCGAATCRGSVNEKAPGWDEVWVRPSELRPFQKKAVAQAAPAQLQA